MGRLILVTGGARSGKSAYAQRRVEAIAGERSLLATCRDDGDPEMVERIARHRAERAGRAWQTVEDPMAPATALSRCRGVVLLDCLTLWVSNLLLDADRRGVDLPDDALSAATRELLAAAREHPHTVFLVGNEVGMGIVPDNALARRFRDLAGRCNQLCAEAADEVVLMVSGVAVHVKGASP